MSYSFSKRVMGIRIDDVTVDGALEMVSSWVKKKREKIIVTPGPEFLLTAQKDEEFKKILNSADLSLPDGFGLRLAGVENRVTGVDFMLTLCREAAKNSWSIGLLGGRAGVAKKTAQELENKFPGIKILATIDGEEADKILNDSDTISNSKQVFDILFAAFGHPRQEKLLWKLRGKFRVGMGVGGAFDYISGTAWRPPRLWRVLGLEWLWRLFLQPWRFGRIFNATIVFPIVLFWNRGKIRS